MAFDSKKTILLEKTYLYVRASLGFQLEGTSTEKIPTNNGFYRFFVDNLQKSIGNSYVNILYDSQDLTLQCFCSDLYMDELMSSDSSAIEDVVEELKKNTTTIVEFESGVSSALEANHQDNVALNAKLEEFESGVSSALAANHQDNVLVHTDINSIFDYFIKNISSSLSHYSGYFNHVHNTLSPNFSNFSIELDMSKAIKFHGYYLIHEYFECYCSSSEQRISFSFYIKDKYKFSNIFNSSLSSCCKIKYLTSDGKLQYKSFYSVISNGNYTLNFLMDNYKYTILSVDAVVCFDSKFYNFATLYGCNNSIAHSNFNSSNKQLILYSNDFHFGSLSQSFCYDFTGGYIDLIFYFNKYYSLDWFNDCNLTFFTDNGDVTVNCSDLQFTLLGDTNFICCTNLPNVSPTSVMGKSVSKLLGIRIYKSSENF